MAGMFGGYQPQALPPIDAPQFPDMLQPKKDGMFGGGKVQIDLGAALAGFAAGMGNPAGAAALRAIHEKRMMAQQQAMQDQQYQRHREDSNADWMSHYNYEINNPKPRQPGDFETLLQSRGLVPGTPEYNQHLDAYIGQRENPPYYFTDPTTGRLMSMPRNGGGAGAPAAPGVTFEPIEEGGPSSQGSGVFPY